MKAQTLRGLVSARPREVELLQGARLIDRHQWPKTPMDTVGDSQKSGISQGCGYEGIPFAIDLLAEIEKLLWAQAPFQICARVEVPQCPW